MTAAEYRARRASLLVVILAAFWTSAGDSQGMSRTPASSSLATASAAYTPSALRLFLDSTAGHPAVGVDTIEVWVCQVPQRTTDPVYNPAALRLPLTPQTLSSTLNRYVSAYFTGLSHGAYRPRFVAGKVHSMTAGETPQGCLDAALDAAAPTSDGVLAVATAEHRPTAPGGFGTEGAACPARARAQCPAAATRRGAYVGASDFHPAWGPEPAVDLEEHEIGHMIGWPHSGEDHGEGHSSGIDVMSDSAAPRDFDSSRRDGQDTLAVNRLAARWLPLSDVAVDAAADDAASAGRAQTVRLAPSTAKHGSRLLILPVDELRFLTVEYLPKTGFDGYFPHGGVTITLIDQTPSACGHLDGTPCTAEARTQRTEVGTAPFYGLLTTSSAPWHGQGWTVSVSALGATATVRATRK